MNNQLYLEQQIGACRPGYSLPQAFYSDEEIFAADLSLVHYRQWLLAGHVSQVPHPGDYFLFELGQESLILIRQQDGSIQALHNTCRHRGSRVCLESCGHVGKLVCPYHQWAYGRDGRLLAARSMGDEFDKGSYPLQQAHVRIVEGLIYVCLAEDAPEFAAAEEVLGEFLRPHGLDRAKICFVADYDVQANWKLLFENNRECYHCAVGHPEFCRTNYDLGMPGDQRKDDTYEQVVERMRAHWAAHGLSTGPVNFPNNSWYRCARVPLRDGFITESMDGQPLGPLMGDLTTRDAGSLRVITFPNSWCHVNSDNANITQLMPMSAQRTRARITWLVHEDATEGIDYDPARVTALWRITTEQDWKLCEDNQLGINSAAYQPGPLSSVLEYGVEYFDRWYLKQLAKHGSLRFDAAEAKTPAATSHRQHAPKATREL